MPKDTFICGTCQETFTELTDFVNHKQRPCSSDVSTTSDLPESTGSNTQEAKLIHLHVDECGQITGMTTEGLSDGESKGSDTTALAFLNSLDMQSELTSGVLEAKEGTGANTTHLIILNRGSEEEADNVEGDMALLSNVNLEGLTEGQFATPDIVNNLPTVDQPQTATTSNNQPQQSEAGQAPKKRRGRGKAGENKNKVLEAVPPSTPRPAKPETGADGKLICPQCSRTFTKERHFHTHKCLASSAFVDITKKEMKIDSGDEAGEDNDVYLGNANTIPDEDDNDADFTAPVDETEDEKIDEQEDENMADEDDFMKKTKKRRVKKRKRSSYQFTVDVHKGNDGAKQMKMAAESLETLPIFKNDKEKSDFENCVDVDLSKVDHMFRIHIIEQELNEVSGMNFNTPTMSSLSVYSCNVCDKVFKSLSHIRLHCITHTDIKPFVCTKCPYSTNSKGNLYTHMRKHTGQFYRCGECDFKTVNKSHLVEHQMIHSNRRSQCLLCQKDYSTLKSLINHVRKYHIDKKGKDYLQTFLQGRTAKGTTVIHQCHICNRKFKKRIDRDRHLFIHDIKDLPHVQQCELCGYWASRKSYLDKHYQKHRVIYCCSLCDQKFLSTVRLSTHLSTEHCDEGDASSLLPDCINRSLYLPEPLVNGQEGGNYMCLPADLQETPTQVSVDVSTSSSSLSISGNNDRDTGSPPSSASPLKDDTKTCGDPVLATETEDNVRLSDGAEQNLEADKLELPVIEESQQDDVAGFGLDDGSKGKDGLMMMLQNPGSDSDQEELQDDICEDDGEKNEEAVLCQSSELGASTQAVGTVDMKNEDEQEIHDALEENNAETLSNPQAGDMDQSDVANINSTTLPAEVSAQDTTSKEMKVQAIIEQLGYRKMSTDIFRKMRDTFGEEECEYCGRLFHSKIFYEPHLRTHTGDKPFGCANCSFRGNTKEQLRKHREREHEKIAFQCKECDFLAPTRTRLWNHQLKHLGINGLSCPKCPSKFDGMKHLRAHILNFHKDMDKESLEKLTGYRYKASGKMGRRSFKCPHCPRVFIRANSELQKHIWIHEGIKPYTCPICPYACRSKNNLQAHMLRHSAEKPFSCSECGKEYKSKTALRWHIRSHKTGKQFKCDKCSYEATQASHLKRHMETHEVLKRFICKHCDYSANTLGYMKIHYAKHHKGIAFSHEELVDPDSAMSDKRVYKCLSCGYLFGNISDLKRHLKIRHHVLMQDIADMNQMQVFAVEVAQYDETNPAANTMSSSPTQPTVQLQAAPQTGGEVQLHMQGNELQNGLSAVNLIQQIMGLSQGESQIQVVSEDGQPLELSPETFVLGQDGQLLLSGADAGTTILPGQKYVIQYYNPEDVPQDQTTAIVASQASSIPTVKPQGAQIHQIQQQQLITLPQHPSPNRLQRIAPHPDPNVSRTGSVQGISSQQPIQSHITQVIAPEPTTQYILNADSTSQLQADSNGQYIIDTRNNSDITVAQSSNSSTTHVVTLDPSPNARGAATHVIALEPPSSHIGPNGDTAQISGSGTQEPQYIISTNDNFQTVSLAVAENSSSQQVTSQEQSDQSCNNTKNSVQYPVVTVHTSSSDHPITNTQETVTDSTLEQITNTSEQITFNKSDSIEPPVLTIQTSDQVCDKTDTPQTVKAGMSEPHLIIGNSGHGQVVLQGHSSAVVMKVDNGNLQTETRVEGNRS